MSQTIYPGQPVKTFDAAAIVADTNGTSFGLSSESNQITWQTSFGTAPDVISIAFQTSNDGTNWNTVVSSTSVTGETGTFPTSANHIRARIVSTTVGSGDDLTVTLIAKTGSGNSSLSISGGGDATAANQSTQITAEQAIQATLGATTGAKVITDANGTIQQYLRGLIYLFITAGQALVTAVGNIAAGTADAGNPVKIGGKGLSLGTNPTSEDADDRVNALFSRIGQLYVLNGHPNIQCLRYTTTGAGTDVALVDSIAAGTRVVVMSCAIITDGATSVQPSAIVGFGTANTPTTTGVITSHPGIVAGGGILSPGMAIGGDGEEVRLTNEAPTSGSLEVLLRYFTITN